MCNGMIISNTLYRYISEVGFHAFKTFKKKENADLFRNYLSSGIRSAVFSDRAPLAKTIMDIN